MDRIWQWAWDRFGARYSWAIYGISIPVLMVVYLVMSFLVVASEKSGRYVEAAAVAVVAAMVMAYVIIRPGTSELQLIEQWAADRDRKVDPATALGATYTWGRGTGPRTTIGNAALLPVVLVLVGTIAGASGSRLVEYGIVGVTFGIAMVLPAVHSFPEGMLRPVRFAIGGDTEIGDSLPRSRPTFAAWSNMSSVANVFVFAVLAAMWAAVFHRASEIPALPW